MPAPDEARDGAPVAADANDVAVLAEYDHVGEANGPGRQLQRVIYVEGVHLHPAPPAVARVPVFLDLVTTKKAFANLATVMPNGSPQVTPVWFDFDGKYIRIVGTH